MQDLVVEGLLVGQEGEQLGLLLARDAVGFWVLVDERDLLDVARQLALLRELLHGLPRGTLESPGVGDLFGGETKVVLEIAGEVLGEGLVVGEELEALAVPLPFDDVLGGADHLLGVLPDLVLEVLGGPG